MPMVPSNETLVMQRPQKFAVATVTRLLTPIKGEPPMNVGKGRKRNPVVTEMYNHLIVNRNQWFHVNAPITSKKALASMRISLYNRAKKDNMTISTSSLFNEETKMYDLWVMLTA
jgi:hypothetical protein